MIHKIKQIVQQLMWRGKLRWWKPRKPKYWNSVRWLQAEGHTKEEINLIMRKHFMDLLNKRVIPLHGKKRKQHIASRKKALKQALAGLK